MRKQFVLFNYNSFNIIKTFSVWLLHFNNCKIRIYIQYVAEGGVLWDKILYFLSILIV
jgi:hypothetical protein